MMKRNKSTPRVSFFTSNVISDTQNPHVNNVNLYQMTQLDVQKRQDWIKKTRDEQVLKSPYMAQVFQIRNNKIAKTQSKFLASMYSQREKFGIESKYKQAIGNLMRNKSEEEVNQF
jgi:hypothetical protein